MIGNDAGRAFDAMAARIEAAARALANARAQNRALARQHDPLRWRRAALLWPTIFGG